MEEQRELGISQAGIFAIGAFGVICARFRECLTPTLRDSASRHIQS